ncbi:hypothetical protein [Orbus mooreae]|uniref:hypothetical protein n=1 Tax=Orbus mooreae TaxID=3074107 RepID=UPI00370D07BA
MLKATLYIAIGILSLSMLSACQFTDQQQQEFNPEKAALARLKVGLGYLAQAKDPTDKTSEEIKLAHYNLTLANQYSPNNPNVMLGMALFDQHVGEYQEAEMIYQAITEMEPNNGLYQIHYGSFLCATNHYEQAIAHYTQAIELNKPRWKIDGLEQMGYCAIQHDDTIRADNAFKTLFSYDSTRRKHVENTARLYEQKGDLRITNYLLTVINRY